MRFSRAAMTLASVFISASPAQGDSQKLLHAERSLYREVLVYETGAQRCMCFTRKCRVGRQSCMDMRNPDQIMLGYPRMMLGALWLNPAPRSVLIIGLGGGTLPRALVKIVPAAAIDVVEIDPAVVSVARKYFDFKTGEGVRVFAADGRVFVKRALREARKYDLIMLDAFDHEYIPEHLLTREFLGEVRGLLAPQAVLAANTFSSSRLYDHESVTYAAVFGTFFNLRRENRVILFVNGPQLPSEQFAANRLQHERALKNVGVDTDRLLPLFNQKPDWNPKARVLTDQYSPANLLNLKN